MLHFALFVRIIIYSSAGCLQMMTMEKKLILIDKKNGKVTHIL
jgi:hypothetical protein